jgi:hypothetical protein
MPSQHITAFTAFTAFRTVKKSENERGTLAIHLLNHGATAVVFDSFSKVLDYLPEGQNV